MNDIDTPQRGRFKSALMGALIGWAERGTKGAVLGGLEGWLNRDIKLTDAEFWSRYLGQDSYAGKHVTVDSALQLSAAWACVRLISEAMATLPVGLFRDQADGSKALAADHSLSYLLRVQPNADQSAATFWQSIVASLLLWGNSYVEITRLAGRIYSLDFLMPSGITCLRNPDGSFRWIYTDPWTRRTRDIPDADMWHIPAFTTDGRIGLSPIRYGAQVMGSAMASDEASAKTFRQGMRAHGLVTMDHALKKEQRQDIREHVQTVAQAGGVMVLEKGAGYTQLMMNPEDAQMLETRAFNVEEICRWFGVPPTMVGHSEKSSNWGTGIEQQMIGFVTFVIRQWSVRIEQGIRKDLLTPVERRTMSAEFALEGLLRADSKTRASFFSIMVQNGIYTRDDCRVLENKPRLGGNAAVLTVQSNLLPIDRLGEQPPTATGDPVQTPAPDDGTDPTADPATDPKEPT